MKTIKCKECGEEHEESVSNCCWISCKCGNTICGKCGSNNIIAIDETELDLSDGSDDNYWCCKRCASCGLNGCGMCV